jgi:hypothetical protein
MGEAIRLYARQRTGTESRRICKRLVGGMWESTVIVEIEIG